MMIYRTVHKKCAVFLMTSKKEAALEKLKLTFQKQCLWNEVLKIEKSSDAKLGRSFEFSLPKEWNKQERIGFLILGVFFESCL